MSEAPGLVRADPPYGDARHRKATLWEWSEALAPGGEFVERRTGTLHNIVRCPWSPPPPWASKILVEKPFRQVF
jgi:hypothetical protein